MIEIERKWVVDPIDTTRFPGVSGSEIVQTYLVPKDDSVSSERVRMRRTGGDVVFTHTIKTFVRAGECIEDEREVSLLQYMNLLLRADLKRMSLKKKRYIIPYQGLNFEYDVFEGMDLHIIEVELESIDQPIPPLADLGINLIKEVTSDIAYSNHHLSILST